MPIDYSKWKDIEVSDDEDDTHPNIDTPSLYRWRHQARLEREVDRKQKIEAVETLKTKYETKLQDLQNELDKTTTSDARKIEIDKEIIDLKKQEIEYQEKEAELLREEELAKWNVDTISHDGFSTSRINKADRPKPKELTEDEREEATRKFLKENKELLKKFGMFRKWDDSKAFLLDYPHLCCEDAANWLVIECLNHQMEEHPELMEHIAHQTIAMQYLLELAKQLDISSCSVSLIGSFFDKIKKADAEYMKAFKDELDGFKERIRKRAKEKIAEAMAEYEAEEREKRLGPGGLDPVEVMEELPESLRKCFESRNIELLKETLGAMPEDEASKWLKQCVDSGLWVADASKLDDRSTGGEGDVVYEDVDDKETNLRQRRPNEVSE